MNNTSRPRKIDKTKLKKVEVPNHETIEAMKEPRGKGFDTIEEVFKELDK